MYAAGWGLEPLDLLRTGKRLIAQTRLLNLRRRQTVHDDRLPELLLQPLAGGSEGRVPDVPALLRGAYAEYGWDPATGMPLPETLIALGLAPSQV